MAARACGPRLPQKTLFETVLAPGALNPAGTYPMQELISAPAGVLPDAHTRSVGASASCVFHARGVRGVYACVQHVLDDTSAAKQRVRHCMQVVVGEGAGGKGSCPSPAP